MKGADDIESYLLRLGTPYERLAAEMWRLKLAEHENLVITLAGPVVVFRIKVMEAPRSNREAFFQRLLSLNTTELVHGAFGLEGDPGSESVVITATLALEELDFSEVESVVADITLALRKLYPQLSQFRSPS
jgi:hypothetical protein